ncbi:prepilin peptidase-dependent protein [Providencia sp. Me31A]|uniref:prepilin peptidase-dependent protein n=1 Tax=Providencia sp. Me31A TaxID=3392637 RepID=UPI003D2C6839
MLTHLNVDKVKQHGFSLVEMLIAMAISSLVCISAMSALPMLFKQTYRSYFQYQLDRDVRHVLLNMEKDFRRIGYCGNKYCEGEPIKITSKLFSQENNSCIIFAYDQDLSGKWVDRKPKVVDTDYFGYRFNNGKLESNRNVSHCDGTRWQSLFDANLINVKKLAFSWLEASQLLEMVMSLETKLLPNHTFNYRILVLVRNL